MEKSLTTTDQTEEEIISQRMAQRAGENMQSFTIMPTLTVYNPSKSGIETPFQIGDIVSTVKTQAGYESEKYERPFRGVILKVRMFLKLKYKYAEGKPGIVTNEFDSYADDELITVKKQDEDKIYQPEFIGNYKQINEKYSLKDDTTIEKKLDLHHAIYVLTDIDSKTVMRIDSKGLSRSNFFDYMNKFSRRKGDFMSAHWTNFDSEISDTDFRGKPRQAPIAAFKFEKSDRLVLEEMKRIEEIQVEFEKQLIERDKMFSGEKVEELKPAEELPTIQIEEPAEDPMETLPEPPDVPEEEEVKIEDVPF